ncbi:MAG: DUF3575 domain-containing protein [Saprospiraceae bacterium]
MKKLFIPLTFLFGVAQAQIDLSINPISLLFKNIDLSADFGLKDDISLDASLGFDFTDYTIDDVTVKNNGIGVRLIGKYYFSPSRGCDRWAIGPYLKYVNRKGTYDDGVDKYVAKYQKFAIGFYTAYKFVSRRNITFEIGLGLGRALLSEYSSDDSSVDFADYPLFNIDVIGRLGIGYRFGGEK